jgi:hypothetical protein
LLFFDHRFNFSLNLVEASENARKIPMQSLAEDFPGRNSPFPPFHSAVPLQAAYSR